MLCCTTSVPVCMPPVSCNCTMRLYSHVYIRMCGQCHQAPTPRMFWTLVWPERMKTSWHGLGKGKSSIWSAKNQFITSYASFAVLRHSQPEFHSKNLRDAGTGYAEMAMKAHNDSRCMQQLCIAALVFASIYWIQNPRLVWWRPGWPILWSTCIPQEKIAEIWVSWTWSSVCNVPIIQLGLLVISLLHDPWF